MTSLLESPKQYPSTADTQPIDMGKSHPHLNAGGLIPRQNRGPSHPEEVTTTILPTGITESSDIKLVNERRRPSFRNMLPKGFLKRLDKAVISLGERVLGGSVKAELGKSAVSSTVSLEGDKWPVLTSQDKWPQAPDSSSSNKRVTFGSDVVRSGKMIHARNDWQKDHGILYPDEQSSLNGIVALHEPDGHPAPDVTESGANPYFEDYRNKAA
jgi:hypothetical protein